MATPTVVAPSAPAQSGGIGGALIGTLLSATILAALIAAAVNITLARRKSREEERARLRDRFAQAYAAYAQYCEFAYAIRRRRPDDPSGERVRISEELRKIQADLSAHEAWVKLESEDGRRGLHGAHPGDAQDRRRRHAAGMDRRTRNQRCWRQHPPEDRRPQPAQALRDGVHGRRSRAPARTGPVVVEVGAPSAPCRPKPPDFSSGGLSLLMPTRAFCRTSALHSDGDLC